MKTELFATPIWTFEAPDCILLNAGLLSVADKYSNYTDYFDIRHDSVLKLKEFISDRCKEILIAENAYASKISGKQTPLGHLEHDTPHAHGSAVLVAVYYVLVPNNSSSILIHDPRGFMGVWNSIGDRGRPYHKIKPYPGMLLVFPSYLIHSVETNLSNETRLCIVCNIE